MDSYEMREEIDRGGVKYFLQTSYSPKKRCIQSSFFKNGTLFDTGITRIDGKPSADELRTLTRETHGRNKERFMFLMNVRDKVRTLSDPMPHCKLARALFRRNLFHEAIEEALLAEGKGDVDSQPYMVIGESYYRLGDYDGAFKAIRKGIDLNPDYPDLHNLLGKIYLKQNRCSPAIESFEKAKELNLYYGEPYLNLAKAYMLNSIVKEDFELSRNLDETLLANLERAVQLNPFIQGEALENVRRLIGEKKYSEALEILDGIEQYGGSSGLEDIVLEMYLLLIGGKDEMLEEDIERHMSSVETIIEQNPTFADGYNSLGILHTAKCKILMDKAAGAFQKALEINGNYRKAQKNLRLTENDRQGIFILLKALLD